ncbi:MAG TPA: galactokinase, partial [Chloroflexota bacterium]
MPATSPESLSVRLEALRDLFVRQFGAAPLLIARAPGRVNLIGEHTDYNDGFVFPIAIERDTLVAARPRADRQVRLYSATLRRASQWSLDAIAPSSDQSWSNYVRGLTRFLPEDGVTLPGADMAIASNVPLGAGVSSSAALEMAAGTALLALAGVTREPSALALLCQRVENRFVGVNSGIMDQFISGLATSNHALLLDCRSLQYEQVLLPADHVIGVADTGVKHGLVASEYNARRAECEEAVRLLQAVLPEV